MNEPLDPLPYREMMAYRRFPDRRTTSDRIALVFDPREGYEQDPGAYL